MNDYFKTTISVGELQTLLTTTHVVLIDCRFDLGNPNAGLAAYRAAHIPGAGYADINRDLAEPVTQYSGRHPLPNPEKLAARLAELGVAKQSQTVVYDAANASFAARAWWLMRWLGAANVAVLDGGFAAWIAAGGTVEAGDAQIGTAQARFAGCADRSAWLSSDEVLAALNDPGRLLVDARSAERYSGHTEPLDPIAGHVAGAVNFPFSGNLDAKGRFLPRDALRERWLARLGGVDAENVIMMCGSGVTACHNLLALEHAGLGTAKLYAGSWSEWIKDPSRPIA